MEKVLLETETCEKAMLTRMVQTRRGPCSPSCSQKRLAAGQEAGPYEEKQGKKKWKSWAQYLGQAVGMLSTAKYSCICESMCESKKCPDIQDQMRQDACKEQEVQVWNA